MPTCETCGAKANLTIPTRLPVGSSDGDYWEICTWCYERKHQHIPDRIETVKRQAESALHTLKHTDYHYAYRAAEQLGEVVKELLALVDELTTEEDR